MSATDELRCLLDERGVEYLDSEDDTTIYYADSGYRYTYNVNPESGWAQLFGYHLTPEQAIEATLGSGECEDVSTQDGRFICSICGCKVWEDAIDNGMLSYCPDCGLAVNR